MVFKRLFQASPILLLAALALAGCGANSATASGATPTPTCTTTPQQQFKQAVGTTTTVSSSQMTVQTTKGQVVVNLTSRTRVTEQQVAAQSDVQDGELIQVEVKSNSDGTYTAVVVALTGRQAGDNGGGNGGPGGGRGGRGTGTPTVPRTPVAQRCPGAGRGAGNGAGGAGGTQGGLPSGAKLLTGTVVSILGQTLTVKAANGTVFTVTLDSTTVYSKIVAGQLSDLKAGQAVRVIGQAQKDGSITAQVVTILLSLPTSQ